MIDPKLVQGLGQYLDDLNLPGTLHMAVLRSTHAHARIAAIDIEPARRLPGVHAVITADAFGADRRTIPVAPFPTLQQPRGAWPLAPGVVRYVGEPVAVVLADDRYQAEDALEAIEVDYEPLPAVASLEAAAAPGAPLVHEDAPGNVAGGTSAKVGDVEAASREADVTIKLHLRISRGHGHPLETRGCVAWCDPDTGVVDLVSSTQSPFRVKAQVSTTLGLPQERLRVRAAQNVGGAFGLKSPTYPEEVLVTFLALQTGRPVKWVEDRREHFVSASHDREQIHEVEVSATRDGRILALRDHFCVDLGAYSLGMLIAQNCFQHLAGMYQIPNLDIAYTCYFSHRTPCGVWRGAGRPQGAFVIERVMDAIARELRIDPLEIRRRNLIPADAFPVKTGIPGVVYDSGNYLPIVNQISAWREKFREEAVHLRADGWWAGVGAACYTESTASNGSESARVDLTREGRCFVYVSAPSQGQGHQATWANLVSRELGVRPEDVTVVGGDTATVAAGAGTFGSRIAAIGGSATLLAAREIRETLCKEAACRLECAPEDVVLTALEAHPTGAPSHSVSVQELFDAVAPQGVLQAKHTFTSPGAHWSAGGHVALVAIDPETCQIQVHRYAAIDDCGTVLEPSIVEGQVIGGIAQGIGNALLEQLVYDDQGQLITGSFMDYLLPTATDIPPMELAHQTTPSPLNPLGVKGAGEGGIAPVAAVLASAVEDAFGATGRPVVVDRFPLSLDNLWRFAREV